MGSVYPLVKVTAGPDVTATVLHDFNTEDGNGPLRRMRVEDDGFSISSPQLQGDPDSIFPQYGPRTITLPIQIWGPKSYALAKVAAAARCLLRDNCWLMVQLTESTKPVWFKLYRPQPGDLDFGYVKPKRSENRDVWRWEVDLPAEPFAYEARETIGPVTISNDPASGTNPCSYVLPAIKGDAPAPLRVDATVSGNLGGNRILLATAAPSAAYTAPIVWQVGTGDSWTAGTDTAAATADAAYSGGSYRAVSFATNAAMATRLSGFAPSAPRAGRYKVLLRMARSDLSSTFAFRFGQAFNFTYAFGDTVRMDRPASTANGHACWLDLGDFMFPRGLPDVDPGTTFPTGAPDVAIQVQRLSGTGAARLDAVMLIPVDLINEEGPARLLYSEYALLGPQAADTAARWDGDREYVTGFNSLGFLAPPMQVGLVGAFPRVTPGAFNILHWLTQTWAAIGWLGADNPDVITSTATLTLSYYPRRLYVGDGS